MRRDVQRRRDVDSRGPISKRISEQLSGVEPVGQSVEQLTHVGRGQIHQEAFGDDQEGTARG
jgi:hypothetical protein